MDATPLDLAYKHSKTADRAVLSGNFLKASEFYTKAADQFELECLKLPNNAATPTIEGMAKFARKRAEYFKSDKPVNDFKAENEPKSSERQKTPAKASSPSTISSEVDPSHSQLLEPLGELLLRLCKRGNDEFVKIFDKCISERESMAEPEINQDGLTEQGQNPSESFYLVKPKQNSIERMSMNHKKFRFNQSDKRKAIDRASTGQQRILQREFELAKPQIVRIEQQIKDQFISQLDRLRAENDQLKSLLRESDKSP